ncbi:MAG: metallophosphoesterase [Bacteroidales bacterium]|nr:metallophosphoesterase [Bacteroidales bacterium]
MNHYLPKSQILVFLFLLALIYSCKNTEQTKTFTFVQMCDPQFGMGGYHHDTIAFIKAIEQINSLNPNLVIVCGDLVDSAYEQSFNDFNRIKKLFVPPVYLASGNHDVENTPTKESLAYYRTKIGDDYYSFDYHRFRFIIVNTQLWKSPLEDETEAQDLWFKETLRNAKEKNEPIVVVGHYPLFVDRPDEIDNYFNLPIKKRLELLDLFQNYGVVAYLGGHVHKTVVHQLEGIQFVYGETTSMNFDNQSLGFRLWTVSGDSVSHRFVELAEPPEEEIVYNPDYQSEIKDTLKK